ncbi:unnamed protein product, partial [Chrysoparadoxa australica]
NAQLQAPAASDFSNARLIEELEGRKLRPTGFRDQDIATLQKVLDEEFELEKETLIKQQKAKREQAAKQTGLQRRRMMLEMQLKEEKEEIAKDERVRFWLDLVKQDATPATARVEVNPVTARALAKAMWTNTSLTSLDLSRNGIDDFAGSYIAKLLMRNTTLTKLDLDTNNIGPKACSTFGESLGINTTLKSLSLESNRLTSGGTDMSGIASLADMLHKNSTLTSLNLWRCCLDAKAGVELLRGMKGNNTVTFLELGNNAITTGDEQLLQAKLEDNVNQFEEAREKQRVLLQQQAEQGAAEKAIRDKVKKERELREWLESQRQQRAEDRRLEEE